MKTQTESWNQKEFLAYLLLYAAHADNQYSKPERNYILSKVQYHIYAKIWKEYALDNDYQHIQKIMAFQKQNSSYSSISISKELESLFLADNHFHEMEAYMLTTIRQLLA